MMVGMMWVICLLFCSLLQPSNGFYLPGVVPHVYEKGESVKLEVTKLMSTKTQMPYDYYSLPYCRPKKKHLKKENIGEYFSGDRIEDSPYNLEMKENNKCSVVCVKRLGKRDRQAFIKAIEDDYRVHCMLDNLPVGTYTPSVNPANKHSNSIDRPFTPTNPADHSLMVFERGFPVGFITGFEKKRRVYLYNHVQIIVSYNDELSALEKEKYPDAEATGAAKVVGFRIQPSSVAHTYSGSSGSATVTSCSNMDVLPPVPLELTSASTADVDVAFTYEVVWEKSDTPWASRWDVYMSAGQGDDSVHWFSIFSSIVIMLFMTVMIALIFVRVLRKDIAQYNDPTLIEEAKEESGWKLVHGDVFRPPSEYPMFLSVFVGTGTQLLGMMFATITFAVLGLLSPANRGSLIAGFIFLFVFMGSAAGYSSSFLYKVFRGLEWKQNTLLTALLYPGVVLGILAFLNFLLWCEGSSGALPFSAIGTLGFLWLCVSVPLVFLGSFFSYKKETPTFPVRTNQIPRAIPTQPWFLDMYVTSFICGILPFGVVSVELYFIMSALWLHHIYYIFGFLFLVTLILLITCAEVSILLCYFQLCSEDYRWWWRSFIHSGACAMLTFVYAMWYHLNELEMHGIVPVILYYGYMTIICVTFFLITGTIGFYSCLWFNWQIYSSIKVD